MYEIILGKEYFNFSAAHFIVFDKTNREMLHGHNYYLTVIFRGKKLKSGKLIDISVIKPKIRSICDEMDHKFILPNKNEFLKIHETSESIELSHNQKQFKFPNDDVIFIDENNSTMENLANIFIKKIIPIINDLSKIEEIQVIVEESKGQKASKIKRLES